MFSCELVSQPVYLFKKNSPFIRTCWLRTAAGGWTTSIRMHSDVKLCTCMFGCTDSEDVLTHYLGCPILWSLAREISGLCETDISIISRLSVRDPSKDKLILLAYCHVLFHFAINDRECVKLHFDGDQSSLQCRLSDQTYAFGCLSCSFSCGCPIVHEKKRCLDGSPK